MKKILIIIMSIFVLFLVIISLIFIPNTKEKQEINKLKKEIFLVDKYISDDSDNVENIRKYIDKKVTSSKRYVLEKAVDAFLTDVINDYEEFKMVINDEEYINILNVDKDSLNDTLEYINVAKDKLTNVKEKFLGIDKNNYVKNNNKMIIEIYDDLLNNKIDLNDIVYRIENNINDLDNKYVVIEYLLNNKDYFDIEDKIIFTNKNVYEEFKKIVDSYEFDISYDVVSDGVKPDIIANDITIEQGDIINLKDYIKCTDETDGELTCNISGTYDNNVVGVYPIDISVTDSSNNISSKTINVIIKEKEVYDLPYYIEVIRNQSTVIVYGKDGNGGYTNIVNVFPCSPGAGNNTPTGIFYTKRGYEWGSLYGNVYGQYSTVITGHILFHSVPYYTTSKDSLLWEAYNNLGTKVSMGCVRLTVSAAKWIFDNCESGTMVKIYDGDLPSGVSKPEAIKIDGNNPNRGWDPTDPDPNNPWNQ